MLRRIRRRVTYANVVATTAGADVLDAEMVLRWIDDGGSVVEQQTDAGAALIIAHGPRPDGSVTRRKP